MKNIFNKSLNGTKGYMFVILICSIISSFLTIYLTKFISFAIDGIIMNKINLPQYIIKSFYNDDVKDKLIVLAFYMFAFIIIICVTNYTKSKFNTKLKLRMNKNLKLELLKHTTYLEYGEYIRYGKSQILQRVSNDSNTFVNFITSKFNLVVDSIFILIFSMYEILNLNVMVSVIISLIILIIIVMSIIYLKITKPIVKNNIDLHENLISRTMNAVYNPKMIKIFNRENKEIEDFNNVSDKYKINDTKLIDYLIYYELIGTGMRKFKDPFIFLIGGMLIINGKMNIGSLMVLITYSSNLLEYVVQLIYMINDVNGFLVPANRISTFLKIDEEKPKKKYELSDISIEFINVSIKLNSITILDNVSFKIKKGQTIYLVGNNGSGKSILIKTLLGFIPYEGNILLGGVNIKELSNDVIRDYVGVVFQEPFIFSDTIKNNIDVFEEKSNLDEVEKIAKICELDEEIEGLPNKYNEILGERGINLSGGQKQRISIARTLMQNKDIIIFDDVLSKVDNITKQKIKNNLKNTNKDKIIIYITQDLLNIPDNETIFFIDSKNIIVSSQKKLIAKNKNYYNLIEICNNVIGGNDE